MSDQTLPDDSELGGDKIYWIENMPVTLKVEVAGKIKDDDSYFFTELRILSGQNRGEIAKQTWSRKWQSGDWNKPTIIFLKTLLPEETERKVPVWSYMLVDKVFTCTPWKNKKGYWNFKNFELTTLSEEDKQDAAGMVPDDKDLPF